MTMNRSLALAAVLLCAAVPAWGASHSLATFIAEQDLDKDGKVTKEEYQKGRDNELAADDADNSGALSREEYVGAFTRRLLARLPSLPADKREEEKVRQLRQAGVRFGVLDSDASGQITHAEYNASGWAMWALHDRDKNGRVDGEDAKVPARDDFVED